MDQRDILRHWYASVYEQKEVGVEDVHCLLSLIGTTPRRILEVACGTGRISVPLAQAGHEVTGFDLDEAMLSRARRRGEALNLFKCYRADALAHDWGRDFDVVVLAGNLLVNIETAGDYRKAQQLFIQKAAACLATGGHMFLDFDVPDWPDQTADQRTEWVCFEGVDDRETSGKFVVISGDYSRATRVDRSFRRYEIAPAGGQPFVRELTVTKHFPTLAQATGWCRDAGFEIERLCGDYQMRPAGADATHAVIWARKV